MLVASPNFMIAPLPKRRSICCKARSIAFSRSLSATGTEELLRSDVGLSFLLIGIVDYRMLGTVRIVAIPLHHSCIPPSLIAENYKRVAALPQLVIGTRTLK